MYAGYDPQDDMDEASQLAWQFYLAVAELALGHLQTFPAGTIAIADQGEDAYWVWQRDGQNYLAWAPIADEMVCFDAAILVLEMVGLGAEEINYRRENLSGWLQSPVQTTLKWQRSQLQQAIRSYAGN
ncbi:hypothetical protein HQ393_05585 [Chitinibacter bivalviorum]|uniref:Uncharacterized protein n=1 Tax=Chitinibacter bivalviorum TaxID=2739434 RepID=A0A7H9BGU5_9NEIS|nr:hypothetical protein [Chitinibacter bivalviorum]QLG87769.1 hypothetical protein HQ393_05585 [Chitinibacter bivalviorum]